MSLKNSVIATNVGAVFEIVYNENGKLLVPKSPQSKAEAFLGYHKNKDEHPFYASKANQYVTKYSAELLAYRYNFLLKI